ncbi:MAG: DUF819 family protein [Lachnospiraceae bacterium]|nr:DUF819 family protein [Lachnospiraceae bacterium]
MSTLISSYNTWMLFAVLTVIAAFSLWLEQRYLWAAKVSGCILCLVMAMALANLRVIPTDAEAYDFVWGYIVPLAIPFLLFKADLRKIWRGSCRIFGIFVLGSFGTVTGGVLAFSLFKKVFGYGNTKSLMAMFVGTYVGGSVNLAAMADATNADKNLISASIVADNLLMVLYFFLLVALPGIEWVRRHFRHPLVEAQERFARTDERPVKPVGLKKKEKTSGAEDYWKSRPVSIIDLSSSIAAACMIVAVSRMLAGFFDSSILGDGFGLSLLRGLLGSQYLMITTITTVLATLFPGFFGNLAGAQEIGTFLIHIFFAVIGAPASIMLIIREAPLLFLFAAVIILMNMLFSLGFGKLLGYSIEEITVASNANIGGPTTAAAFAIAKGWHSLIVPALLAGTLGYVIGNYYGIFLFTIL